ncbi:MAG TPA: tyrosine--tRNA ligase, partial [Candidatus Cloacimonas sp.]|nr:tyrosine--tRNA ligase [Candidatus Cloacimonas sp.]
MFEKEMKIIEKGTEEIISKELMLTKLQKAEDENRPLRIKYGIDPTGYE